jgi:predicted GTPase
MFAAAAARSAHPQRFVANQLREHFGFEGVPVRVVYREKRRGKRPAATASD